MKKKKLATNEKKGKNTAPANTNFREVLKGCARYIFASLFFTSKREQF